MSIQLAVCIMMYCTQYFVFTMTDGMTRARVGCAVFTGPCKDCA